MTNVRILAIAALVATAAIFLPAATRSFAAEHHHRVDCREVMRLIDSGRKERDVARELGIPKGSVNRCHREAIERRREGQRRHREAAERHHEHYKEAQKHRNEAVEQHDEHHHH